MRCRYEESKSAFKILTGKSIGMRHLGRPRRRWEEMLELILKNKIVFNTKSLVDTAQDTDH